MEKKKCFSNYQCLIYLKSPICKMLPVIIWLHQCLLIIITNWCRLSFNSLNLDTCHHLPINLNAWTFSYFETAFITNQPYKAANGYYNTGTAFFFYLHVRLSILFLNKILMLYWYSGFSGLKCKFCYFFSFSLDDWSRKWLGHHNLRSSAHCSWLSSIPTLTWYNRPQQNWRDSAYCLCL